MAQQHRISGAATSIRTDENGTHVRYHNTDVVTFTRSSIILRTGGWRTNTTKTRMNQAASQFALGYRVYQKDFDWFAQVNGRAIPFNGETLEIDRP